MIVIHFSSNTLRAAVASIQGSNGYINGIYNFCRSTV